MSRRNFGGIAAFGPKDFKQILGHLARNRALRHQVQHTAKLCRRNRALRNRLALFVQTTKEFIDHPVCRLLAVAALRHGLEEASRFQIGGQHVGVIVGQAEIAHEAGFLGVGQFWHPGGNVIDPSLFDFQRQKVRAGEIPVIMRLFLAAHAAGFVLVRVIEPGFLHDRAAILQNGDLAARFIVDRQLDEAHRVHVLDLAARAQMAKVLRGLIFFILAGAADRHVHIGAQVAVLHVTIAGAQIAQDLPQLDDIGRGLFRATNVGARDDFHQRNAGAVEIDERHRRVHVVDRLARVLFEVDAFDPHQTGDARRQFHQHFALADDGVIELRNLIALRQIGVEIVLAVKGRPQVDRGFQPKPGAHRLFHAELVDHRQHPRHCRIDEGDVRVRLGPDLRRSPREQLGVRRHLGVNLHPDHQFPVVLYPGNDLGFRRFIGQIQHGILRGFTRLFRQAAPRRQGPGWRKPADLAQSGAGNLVTGAESTDHPPVVHSGAAQPDAD
ncbi:MAG: hypothetical protein ACD_54C00703G0001 [uncultured bacterium]|nr:MAG: hypothetical protein ACD_54C00703G0001 [uncultured bacterium]